jgi:hypothetical protein
MYSTKFSMRLQRMGIAGWKFCRERLTVTCAAWSCWLDDAGLNGGRRVPLASNSWLNQSGDKSPHSKFGVLRLVGALDLHTACSERAFQSGNSAGSD